MISFALVEVPAQSCSPGRVSQTTVFDVIARQLRCTAANPGDNVPRKAPSRRPRRTTGENEMEWEEALLGAWNGETPAQSAAYYRRKAARARQIAEEATTRAMKTRILDEAAHFERLAADADRGMGETVSS